MVCQTKGYLNIVESFPLVFRYKSDDSRFPQEMRLPARPRNSCVCVCMESCRVISGRGYNTCHIDRLCVCVCVNASRLPVVNSLKLSAAFNSKKTIDASITKKRHYSE